MAEAKIPTEGQGMRRRTFNWTEKQRDKLHKVQDILQELAEYKPLTLRQIYYQLVGKGFIENTTSQYGMLSKLVKWGRIDGEIPWEDMEDRLRTFRNAAGWTDDKAFIADELGNFLRGYRRDLLQTQEKYIEVWIEKDALRSIFERVCHSYCVSVIVCRGFTSVSVLNDFRERLLYYRGRDPVMLYFGDFDPSGVEMLPAMRTTLEEELGVTGVTFKRIALLKGDIQKYRLPHNPSALKRKDTRTTKHVEAHGEVAVELDALRPDILEGKIRKAIDSELDAKAFRREVATHRREIDKLDQLKEEVEEFIENR